MRITVFAEPVWNISADCHNGRAAPEVFNASNGVDEVSVCADEDRIINITRGSVVNQVSYE